MKIAKEFYFTGILKSIVTGSKGNRKVIKIDDINLSSELQKKADGVRLEHQLKSSNPSFTIETFFKNKKVKIILEE